MNLKAFGILLLLVAMTAIGSLGCTDPDPYTRVTPTGPWVGEPVTQPLPDPQSCMITDGDRENSIGVSVCGENGVALTYRDKVTGFDVTCYRCNAEFNAHNTQPVPAEGCFVWRDSAPIAGLCVNSCMQCGSAHDNY